MAVLGDSLLLAGWKGLHLLSTDGTGGSQTLIQQSAGEEIDNQADEGSKERQRAAFSSACSNSAESYTA